MEKKYKYLVNMGLAFDEERLINRLNALAKEGWILQKMSLLRYRLVKDQPRNIIYAMDYKELDKNDNEYFQLFESSGWDHICSYGPFHFFAASPETIPIYTEKENQRDKYTPCHKVYNITAGLSLTLIILVTLTQMLLGNKISGTVLDNILFIIFTLSVMFAVPSIMVSIAFYRREKRILNK